MRRSYLTLLEVALVLLVLTVVVAMVLPVFSKVRETNNRPRCAGNLKQVGLALLMYSGDHDGYFPAVRPNGSTNFEPLTELDYLNNGKVWSCSLRSEVHTLASNSAFVYIGSGLRDDNDNATNVSMAYDPYANHPNRAWTNELYIDGHVKKISSQLKVTP